MSESLEFRPSGRVKRRTRLVLRALARYHRHRVVGLDDIPERPFILAVNHSLATYDGLLLFLRHPAQ